MIPEEILNYQIVRLLGSGGMGEVYLARNKNIDQYVAVKVLHPKYANNPMLRSRFKQEAVMLNGLNHPNIVRFLNYVENENGVFLIMEYVEGDTLEDFIAKKSGLIVEQRAYPMFVEILQAFAYAHQRGIIHRDIKPSNIFLGKDGHIKVMDFGIAQIVSEVNEQQGATASMGTPAYMSPEQVYGQELDLRSDIYSLGVLFHQMLTGRAPYDSTTMSELEIKRHVVNDRLPRMKNYYQFISDGLQVIIDQATSKKREERQASCNEMLKQIKAVLAPEKKSRTPYYIAAAVVVLLCAAGGWLAWDYFRVKVNYYKDYAELFGVPQGIGELSDEEMEHRQTTYRFESSRWKVRRVTLVNAHGIPVKHFDTEHTNSRYSDTYYYYNDDGQLDYKKVYDQFGKLLYKIDYDENLKVAMFKYDDELGTAKRLLSSTTALYNVDLSQRSSITRHVLSFDDEGHLEKVEYASGEDNIRVGDGDNIYGQEYSYDDKGRITEVRFLGRDGKVRGNKIGLAIKQYEYDENDNWIKVTYLSADGKPSHDGNNCPVVELDYDNYGNRISERYFTIDGKPSYRTDISACGVASEFDEEGNRVLTCFIDGDEKVMTGADGYAQIKSSYDENGFCTEEQYLDKNGDPTYCVVKRNDGSTAAFSTLKYTYNELGMQLSRAFYNRKGHPIVDTDGVHKYKREYDEVGNIIEEVYLDKMMNPTKNYGYETKVKYKFNDLDQLVQMAYYDKDDRLTNTYTGIAICKFTYDNSGNVTKYEYFAEDGRSRANSISGFAIEEVEYDNIGNIKSIKHIDKNDKVVDSKEYTYDRNTNFTTEIKDKDDRGNVTSTMHYKHDKNGNVTQEWTTNERDRLDGVIMNHEYDKNNREKRNWTTNEQQQRVNQTGTEYCEAAYKYDDRGNCIEVTFFSTESTPALDAQRTFKRIRKFDDCNRVIYEKNLGTDGQPIHGTGTNPEGKVEYDKFGNITLLACYDGYGNPTIGADGYYVRETEYNDENLLERVEYRDKDNSLVKVPSVSAAKTRYKYDDERNRIEEKYFTERGSLDYTITSKYNEKNKITESCLYNADGELDDGRAGFCRGVIEYESDQETPSKLTFYRKDGTIVQQEHWNKITEEWE